MNTPVKIVGYVNNPQWLKRRSLLKSHSAKVADQKNCEAGYINFHIVENFHICARIDEFTAVTDLVSINDQLKIINCSLNSKANFKPIFRETL